MRNNRESLTTFREISKLGWLVARRMVVAWVVTIPCGAIVGAFSDLLLGSFFKKGFWMK